MYSNKQISLEYRTRLYEKCIFGIEITSAETTFMWQPYEFTMDDSALLAIKTWRIMFEGFPRDVRQMQQIRESTTKLCRFLQRSAASNITIETAKAFSVFDSWFHDLWGVAHYRPRYSVYSEGEWTDIAVMLQPFLSLRGLKRFSWIGNISKEKLQERLEIETIQEGPCLDIDILCAATNRRITEVVER
ncbi:hypothetical protein EJ08DRAFT_120473 [Tothia fuscella]|uniref:Uncharacterized protein n=1 Tax=Tothia fuscella TaxID=1048955 RepID=A0A9P4NDQ5_9PEZI|nr:hypothetical protein EJ08DRAFT_120473 [Tothia fuscella]